jgi:hypothetical protein
MEGLTDLHLAAARGETREILKGTGCGGRLCASRMLIKGSASIIMLNYNANNA